MTAPLSRRALFGGVTLATWAGVAGWAGVSRATANAAALAGAHGGAHAALDLSVFRYAEADPRYADLPRSWRPVVRKSAARMTQPEIERFSRAFTWAVSRGYLDVFSDEHFNHRRHRQHGADVLASAPPAVSLGLTPAWGHRLLPWHRSFIIEAEQMLKAALHERNRREGRDPSEAALLFMPYWDAAHDQDLPRWVRHLQPRGGTAIVPEGLPPGHAGYGRPVGSRYRIDFNRWPAGFLVFNRLPPVSQVARILGSNDWATLYSGIDQAPEIVSAQIPEALQALAALAQRIPDNPYLQIILAATDPAYPKDPQSQVNALNAFLAVGHLASVEAAKPRPDRVLIQLITSVYSAFRFPPHVVLHFWAGGLDPRNPNVRGTVTYFNELTVDPVFWMLHGELDRYWYTWQQTHDELPPLTGDDRVFQPLTPDEGRWYRGGRTYSLDQLANRSALNYRYDRLFTA